MSVPAIKSTLDALACFPAQLGDLFGEFARAHWHWRPDSWDGIPSELLDPVGQLCHVRDIEALGYHERFARLLAEEFPVLAAIDGDALVIELDYAHADPAQALAAFARARGQTCALLAILSPEQLARRGQFDGYGTVTVRGLIHFLASHDQQHLAGMQWLLGRIASAPD